MAFVNPYTFIPLRSGDPVYGQGENDADAVEERPYRGVLHCTLTAKTPLSVPDVSQKTDSLDLPFYRKDGAPAIPGSSIRGCVRSVYEALTDSCMRTNSSRLHSASSKKRPALLRWKTERLKYTQVELVDAERLRVVNEDLVRNSDDTYKFGIGQAVRFQGHQDGEYATRTVEAIEALGGRPTFEPSETGYFLYVHTLYSIKDGAESHNHPSVFKESGGRRLLDAVDEDCFKENVTMYAKNSEEAIPDKPGDTAGDAERLDYARAVANYEAACAYKDAMEEFFGMKGQEQKRGDMACLPVWYSSEVVKIADPEDSDSTKKVTRFQLAPAQLSRSVYPQTPLLMVGKRAQCSVFSRGLCPACTLFGFVSQRSGGAKAGRLRFSDATVVPHTLKLIGGQRLPTLLEPRQSAFEFYLRNDREDSGNEFTPYTEGTTIAGRKAYWHHQRANDWKYSGGEDNIAKFNLVAELVDAGTTFRFDVFVDGVSRRELNQLVCALTYGQYWDDGKGDCYHKIGHGKPVGLGSAKIEVTSVCLRQYDGKTGEYSFDRSGAWAYESAAAVEEGLSNVAAAKAVASFGAIPAWQRISYPAKTQGGDIFEWFADNRDLRMRGGKAGIAAAKYTQVLPKLDEGGEQTLA